MSSKILVVEDEAIVALSLVESLKRLGYTPSGPVSSGESALKEAEKERPDLVLMDIRIKGELDGIETAAKMTERFSLPVIYLTAYTDDATLSRAQLTEPHGYLVKPYQERELRSAIEIALYRHRSELRLKKVERWMASTLRSIGDAVLAVDTELHVTFLNPVAELLTGWSSDEANGRPLQEVFPLHDPEGKPYNVAQAALEEGVVVTLEPGYSIITKSGHRLPVEDSAAPIRDEDGRVTGAVICFRNSEEREILESRILSIQRLESLGRLSAGIAHDFNNLLTVIGGNLEAIKDGEQAPQALEEALQATRRASRLTRQLLAFSHPRYQDLKPVELKSFLEDFGPLLDSLLGERHHFCLNLCSESVIVPADQTMLEQVVTNLVINARDAQPEGGSVELTLSLQKLIPPVDTEDCEMWAVISVRDEGCGIRPEDLPKVFEPFFTTKGPEHGTGLGLATCHGIIRSHGGWIDIKTSPGEGSLFSVHLPLIRWTPEREPSIELPREGQRKGSLRIMVVEDEPSLARLTRRVLEKEGHSVSVATSGDEALSALEGRAVPDLILSDLQLPGSYDGRALGKVLRETYPGLMIAYMSGYSPEFEDETFNPSHFLPKPFTPRQLADFVNSATVS